MTRLRPDWMISRSGTLAALGVAPWAMATLFATAIGACAPAEPTGGAFGTGGSPTGSGGSGTGGIQASGGSPGTGGLDGTGGIPGTGGAGTGGSGTGGRGGSGTGGRGGATTGTGGQGGGTVGTGGTSGGSAGAGAGGRAVPSADPATFGLNGASKCASGNFAICEDFEATAVGAIPAGWAKEGTWVTTVSADDKARGTHALRIDVGIANNGRGFLNKTAAQLGPLATKHYGRIFYKLQNPPSLFVHWDFFHGPGPYGAGNTNDVRWGFTGTGNFTYLFNVQTSGGEFGVNSPGTVRLVVNTWTCVEWLLDSTVAGGGEARFWLNGTEVTNMHRTGAQAQIPVFTRYGIGWELFNATDTPSIVFIDEVVFDSQPIGCNN